MNNHLKLAFDAGAQEAQQGFNPKLAYEAGAQQALVDAGLMKVAENPDHPDWGSLPEGVYDSLQSDDVPRALTVGAHLNAPDFEQIPGATEIEMARRTALGHGDFHGETNLMNFDEKLKDYDPGAYGEYQRYIAEARPQFFGGGRRGVSADTRSEYGPGHYPEHPGSLQTRQHVRQGGDQAVLNLASLVPEYTSVDVREQWKNNR